MENGYEQDQGGLSDGGRTCSRPKSGFDPDKIETPLGDGS